MCVRKAEVVVPLLQGLTEVQIASHSRFAAKTDFPAGLLVQLSEILVRITAQFVAGRIF